MSDLISRFSRMDRSHTLNLGDLPPLEQDPARSVQAIELQAAISQALGASSDPEDMSRTVVITGVDVIGAYSAFDTDLPTPCSVTFTQCRFRSGFDMKDWRLGGSLRLADVVLHGDCTIRSCHLAGSLTLQDVEAHSVTLDGLGCTSLHMEHVTLSGDCFLDDCTVDKAALLLRIEAAALPIINSRIDLLEINGGALTSRRGATLRRCNIRSASLHDIEAGAIEVARCELQELNLYNPVPRVAVTDCTVASQLIVNGHARLTELNLRNVKAEKELWLLSNDLPAKARLSVYGCTIAETFGVAGDTRQADGIRLDVSHTKVEGTCRLTRPGVADISLWRLDAGKLAIGSASLANLSLRDVTVEGDCELHGLEIRGLLSLSQAKLGRTLSIIGLHPVVETALGSVVQDVTAGNILLQDCSWHQRFGLHNCGVADELRLTGCRFSTLSLETLRSAGPVTLYDCRLQELVMRGGNATALRFETKDVPELWAPGSSLTLRDVHLGQMTFNAVGKVAAANLFPARIDLRGCVYDDLPRFGGAHDPTLRVDLCETLVSRGDYDPQPYVQMARLLRAQGHVAAANHVLVLERRAATRYAWRNGDYAGWIWLAMLRPTIGYGIGLRSFRAVGLALIVILAGAAVLSASPRPTGLSETQIWLWRLGASLDQLLPIIKLSPKYAAFFDERSGNVLSYWQNAYFAVHRLIGWVLGTFILAGLSGLTPKAPG